jgi:acyl carrier protein
MKFNEKKYLNIFIKILKISKSSQEKIIKKKLNIYLNKFSKWDSMSHVSILVSIEKNFKIKINSSNAKFFNSYNDGLDYLKNKIK